MRYINIETKEETDIYKIRLEHSNMSIPDNADLTSLGYIAIELTEKPYRDGYYAVEGPVIDFKQTWELIPYDKPDIKSITIRQARLYLLSIGLLDTVNSIVAENEKLKIEWEYATEVFKDHYFIKDVAEILGLSIESIDTMFNEASKL